MFNLVQNNIINIGHARKLYPCVQDLILSTWYGRALGHQRPNHGFNNLFLASYLATVVSIISLSLIVALFSFTILNFFSKFIHMFNITMDLSE